MLIIYFAYVLVYLFFYRIADLQIGPPNIAIPTSLITQVDAQLTWTFYVQMMDVFLIREDLLEAVQVNKANMH